MKSTIIYEDNDIIVVDKPAGMAVQSASASSVDVESELKSYMSKTSGIPQIFVIHRLDQPVSGLVVFAKNNAAAAKLSKAVSGDGMKKIYHARVYKVPPKEEAELVDYVTIDKRTKIAQVVSSSLKGQKDVKEARLSYRVLKSYENEALLEVTLETGRFHQIRVQLSHMGYPILGDKKYGSAESMKYSEEKEIRNICLRAVSVSFVHPTGGKCVTFSAEG